MGLPPRGLLINFLMTWDPWVEHGTFSRRGPSGSLFKDSLPWSIVNDL